MARMARLLPVDYFHVVFTVPDDQIAGLALRNRELFFNAMYASGSQTLLTLGNDKKRLGAQLGLTAILHTWTRDLRFHPHLHCIVTGGGLTRDGLLWKTTRRDYLFPVRVLSDLFRDKLVAALDEAYRDGRLKLDGVPGFGNDTQRDVVWKRLKRKLYNTKWVSYAKPPFAGPEAVYKYLGRYTHRVGISNQRLISLTEDAVTFRTRGDDTATLHPQEFIRRFLLHVLPKGFVKLRHYGLLAPGNVNTKLATARRLLETIAAKESPPAPVLLAIGVPQRMGFSAAVVPAFVGFERPGRRDTQRWPAPPRVPFSDTDLFFTAQAPGAKEPCSGQGFGQCEGPGPEPVQYLALRPLESVHDLLHQLRPRHLPILV
jgi:hypothetical protein